MLRSFVIFPAALSAALFFGQDKSEPAKQQTTAAAQKKAEPKSKDAPAYSGAKKADDSKSTSKKEDPAADKDAKLRSFRCERAGPWHLVC